MLNKSYVTGQNEEIVVRMNEPGDLS
jgi:hypothetical protein